MLVLEKDYFTYCWQKTQASIYDAFSKYRKFFLTMKALVCCYDDIYGFVWLY